MRKFAISLTVFLGFVVLLTAAAFVFREPLTRFAAGRFFAGGELTLTRLEGLEITATRLAIAELEFLLHESGQRLQIDGFNAAFRTDGIRTPKVETVTMRSVRLLAPDPDSGIDDATEEGASDLRVSAMLALLRNFPLTRIDIAELQLPQRSLPLSFTLQREDAGLSTEVTSGALVLRGRFNQASAGDDARLELALTRDALSVGNFMLTLVPSGEVYAVAGSGRLEVEDLNALLGELEQAPLPLPLRSAQLDWDIAGTLADEVSGTRGSGEPQAFTVGFQPGSRMILPAAMLDGLGQVALEFPGRVELSVASGAGLLLSGTMPVRAASTWDERQANVDANLRLTDCELRPQGACGLSFDGKASLGDYSLAGIINATARSSGAEYRLASNGLVITGLPQWLPAFDVQGLMRVDGDALDFETTLLARDTPTPLDVSIDGSYDLANGSATFKAALPELEFGENSQQLSAWFSEWPYAFDVLAGRFAANAELQWRAGALGGTVDARLQELGGFQGDYFFRGLSGNLRAQVDTAAAFPLSTPPLTLIVAGVDVGLPMENLRLDFSIEPSGVLQIAAFSTELLDGTISGRDISYDFTRERNEVLIEFSGLEIERMLELIDYKGVQAEGAVSGVVPLTLTPNGVEVAQGRLAADAPGGSIRYLAAAAGATGNAGVDLMHQALGNYRFESLTSGIEYSPDGELLLEMKLQGHNPDMQNGQRINLNLNISDNIPALLESLQAARRIEDFLEEQYR